MINTLTTTAVYQRGVLLPKIKPDREPEEVVVTFILPRALERPEREEWREQALALEGFLKAEDYPEFADPVAYVRKMRDQELEDDRGYKHLLHRSPKEV